MYKIFDGAFNITNVCNLTCSGCESFNNFPFKNHFKFDDYKDLYQRWSELVSINIITIHGGEPFTNPDILDWAQGLMELWPDANKHYVSTNGTLLKNNIDTCKKLLDLGWYIDISVHDPALLSDIKNSISTVLEDRHYREIKKIDETKFVASNSNKPYFVLYETTEFIDNARQNVHNGVWRFHRSDPTASHKICLGGEPPCTHFNKGRIYQCHLTSVSEDLIKQFPIEEHAVDILNQYNYATPFDDNLDEFFSNLHKPMAQCELCPQSSKTHSIAPLPLKKPTI